MPAALETASSRVHVLRRCMGGVILFFLLNSHCLAESRPRISFTEPLAPKSIREGQGIPSIHAPDSPSAVLDPRVSQPIRMGDDPSRLPVNTRAQAEPHLARNPLDPDHLIATFQEGRWTDGGAINCGFALSTNGGLSWSRSLLPGITTNFAGTFRKATDPVVAFNHKGQAFINTLASVDAGFTKTHILLSRATADGFGFEPPIRVFTAPNVGEFADKNWIAIDRSETSPHRGRIAISFTLFRSNGTTPIYVTLSDDDGQTWSPARPATALGGFCQGSTPLFLPDGRLVLTYWNFGVSVGSNLDDSMECTLSEDGGVHFGAPVTIGKVIPYIDPVARDGYFLPNATVNPVTGTLHVTCQGLLNGSPRILVTRSADSGASWSPLIPVSDNSEGTGVFNPAIDVGMDGNTVAMVFADKRDHPREGTLVEYYATASFDGGLHWLPNWRISPTSVDLLKAPLTGAGRMIGDYFGVVAPANSRTPMVAALIGTDTGDPDPIAIRVGLSPSLTFASWKVPRFSFAELLAQENEPAGNDLDLDGFSTFQEYAFGLNPRLSDESRASARIATTPDGPMLELRHRRLRHTEDLEMSWQKQRSAGRWETLRPAFETSEPTEDPNVEDWIARVPLDPRSDFFRVQVTRR